jgi:hypothetical protein
MNFILGALGANITLGLVSSITSTANGVYTLSSNIVNSTSSGANEVKQIIKDLDLEFKIKNTQYFLCELKITKNSPYTILYCVQSIRDAINDISKELETIHYRLQYNDNLWFGSAVRSYRFHNCKTRIQSTLNNLEVRRETLLELMGIETLLVKNPSLENDMSDIVLQIDDIDQIASANVRRELVRKIDYINKKI